MSCLQTYRFRPVLATIRRQSFSVNSYKRVPLQGGNKDEAAELEVAREWYKHFDTFSIPTKISETGFSRSSGPGGQKVNKTSSKATTVWPLHALSRHVPKILHQGLRDSRYYVLSSDSISIQCDTARSQTANKEQTRAKLYDEIVRIYKSRIPGVTSPEQRKRIEQLKKADNLARLRMKKILGDKKRSRKDGGGRGGDF